MKMKGLEFVLSLDTVIEITKGVLKEAYDSRKRRKVNKEAVDRVIEYNEALIYHLSRLKEHETSANQCD